MQNPEFNGEHVETSSDGLTYTWTLKDFIKRYIRIVNDLFEGTAPDNDDIINDIINYIQYSSPALDNLTKDQLELDYEDFISK